MYLKPVQHIGCYLSGGCDSAVAALMLKGRGNFITGIFLRNKFQDDETVGRQREKAQRASEIIKIPFREITLEDEDWDTFARPAMAEYEQGNTPCLDTLYHRHILFGGLLHKACNELGANYVVTGHFARTTAEDRIDKWIKFQGNKLKRGFDALHDESYRLCQVPQACLRRVHFPLGDMDRGAVDKILQVSELSKVFSKPHQQIKPEIVDRSILWDHIKEELPSREGNIYEFNKSQSIGKHKGLHLWEIGQEMEIDGKTFYVAEKDSDTNYIKIVRDYDHPSLYCERIFTTLATWSYEVPYDFYERQMMDVLYRIGPNHPLTPGTLTVGTHNEYCGNDHIILSSSRPIRAASPGRVVAFYRQEQCIGGARIMRAGPSQYVLNPELRTDSTRSKLQRILDKVRPTRKDS